MRPSLAARGRSRRAPWGRGESSARSACISWCGWPRSAELIERSEVVVLEVARRCAPARWRGSACSRGHAPSPPPCGSARRRRHRRGDTRGHTPSRPAVPGVRLAAVDAHDADHLVRHARDVRSRAHDRQRVRVVLVDVRVAEQALLALEDVAAQPVVRLELPALRGDAARSSRDRKPAGAPQGGTGSNSCEPCVTSSRDRGLAARSRGWSRRRSGRSRP